MPARAGQAVVVIGGGISGLATAALLATEGHQVTILEKQEALGGRAYTFNEDGFRFDAGPSWYLMPEVIDHYFQLLGSSAEQELDLVKLDPGYRLISEGAGGPVDVPAGRAKVVELFERLEPGAGARLEQYLDSAAETYTMAKRRFLYPTFQSFAPLLTPDILARLPRLARLLLEPLHSYAKRYVSNPSLQQILEYPAVFLGASPFTAPSMYHLMSHLDLDVGVSYPMGGFARLVEALERQARGAGVAIRSNTEVLAIETVPTGSRRRPAAVRGVRCRTGDGAQESLAADVVISAADLHHSETALLPRHLQTYPERYWSRRTAGPSALLLYLGVRGGLPQLEHHTLLFTADWEKNFRAIFGKDTFIPEPASMYVCKPSATDPGVAPEGHENVFVLVPIPPDPGLGGSGDETLEKAADAVIGQLSEWAGIPDLAERIVVRRMYGPADFERDYHSWKGTSLGPAHTLRQSAFFRAGNVSRKVQGLYYAGASTIPGIGIPMCLISAELVVKRLRGDTSTGPLPVPLRPAMAERGTLPDGTPA
ncbi:phytoene desaturase family protein [Pseudarthrobacter phenanthrenivorans]|uniref:Phytoene dehydrogenase n=1 Tax=Pseudarthrobacter phenanthrenivorans TaxID=361575 RepID=A0A0B4DKP7_PSEPS|nr:phytoene desaturase family protein [Pseudarthrobacter phenanthrenivorans]KIC69422.1 phytoene dehydrogenase [Pseudarthrobacter phenanthrenivorans]